MNIWVFLAGISIGLVADKLYNSYIAKKTQANRRNETLKVEAEEQSLTKEQLLEDVHDDLTQLKGVGPKLAESLDTIGIYNYEQLSETPIDILLEKLHKTGCKFGRSVILLIMERAKQAAKER